MSIPAMSNSTPAKVLKFPENFLWGTATSPTQVEGHIQNEWTDFVAQDGGTCHVACDHYHRYPEDVDWMRKLNQNGYRMGIEWSRLQDCAYGPLNQTELARYIDLIDRLRAAGITPMIVLHHFSNPPWINELGGWTNAATIPAFVDYVGKLVVALKDRVYLWNTFNEPDTYACVAYLLGGFPPQHKWSLGRFRKVIGHMARAHVKVSRIIRREGVGATGRKPEVGIAKNWTYFEAYKKYSLWDRTTAAACHYTFNQFVLDAFLGGWRRKASTYVGLNYYGRVRFHHFRAMIPASGAPIKQLADFGFVCDDMVERYPVGFGKAAAVSTAVPPAHVHHGTRRGFEQRGLSHPGFDVAFGGAARGHGGGRGCARLFLLVADGQFRVAVWLYEEVRAAGGGFCGQKTAAYAEAAGRGICADCGGTGVKSLIFLWVVSLPWGEDFLRTRFSMVRPSVRAIQRFDYSPDAGTVSPSPGGEGRDEGERYTIRRILS